MLMTQSLYMCFESQLKQIRNETYQRFEKDALKKPQATKDQVNENFHQMTETIYNDTV